MVSIGAAKEEVSKASPKEFKIVKPGDRVGFLRDSRSPGLQRQQICRTPGKPFHPKQNGKVGYVVITTRGGVSIYHTADSDLVSEADDLRPEIALLPVSGTYVMTVDEARGSRGRIKPKIAIPMHYGAIVGSEEDAKRFKNSVRGLEVHILTVG